MVNIRIGLQVKVDEHPHQAVVGVDGIHVVHVIHAAHLLLDGSGDRLLDGLGVSAYVGGLNEDFGRHDLRELGDRQSGQGNEPNDDHDDRNDHGDDGPIYEEFGHLYCGVTTDFAVTSGG